LCDNGNPTSCLALPCCLLVPRQTRCLLLWNPYMPIRRCASSSLNPTSPMFPGSGIPISILSTFGRREPVLVHMQQLLNPPPPFHPYTPPSQRLCSNLGSLNAVAFPGPGILALLAAATCKADRAHTSVSREREHRERASQHTQKQLEVQLGCR